MQSDSRDSQHEHMYRKIMDQAAKSLPQTDLAEDVREKILKLVNYTEYVKNIEEERRIKEEEEFEKEFQRLEKEYRKLFSREGEQQKDEKELQKQNARDFLQHKLEVERNQWLDDPYEEHVQGKKGGKPSKRKENDVQNDMVHGNKKSERKPKYQPRNLTQYSGISVSGLAGMNMAGSEIEEMAKRLSDAVEKQLTHPAPEKPDAMTSEEARKMAKKLSENVEKAIRNKKSNQREQTFRSVGSNNPFIVSFK